VTVLGGIMRRSVENPQTPLTSASLLEWLTGGKSIAGVPVSEQRVLGLPAYYRAVAATAGTLAALPVKVYGNGTRTRVTQRTVLDYPNPRQTRFEYRFTQYANAITWGNAYARKIRNRAYVVYETWPIHPSRVRVEEVDLSPEYRDGKLFLVRKLDGSEQRLSSWDVFHLPYFSVDGVQGVRPLQLFRTTMGMAIAGDESAANFYANGSQLSGILTTEQRLDQDAADTLKARWKAKTAGVQRTGDIAILDSGATFQPITIPPADAQLLESRQWSVAEIARMVGTPPHIIGDVERSTSWGTGIESQVLGWVKFTLQAWLTATEQRYTQELLPGGWDAGSWFAEHSLEGLLRGDSAARAEFYRVMVMLGSLTRNEVRGYENLEPIEGGDVPIVPSNMTLIPAVGDPQPLSGKGAANASQPA